MAGKLRFENGAWILNNESGRYGLKFVGNNAVSSFNTPSELQAAADLLKAAGLNCTVKTEYLGTPPR